MTFESGAAFSHGYAYSCRADEQRFLRNASLVCSSDSSESFVTPAVDVWPCRLYSSIPSGASDQSNVSVCYLTAHL